MSARKDQALFKKFLSLHQVAALNRENTIGSDYISARGSIGNRAESFCTPKDLFRLRKLVYVSVGYAF
jgi:hypothetical protein